MGGFTGKPIHAISSAELTAHPETENPAKFQDRISSALKDLSHRDEVILVVSHAGVGRMIQAIREVRKGNAYFSPAIATRLRQRTFQETPNFEHSKPAGAPLTQREAEVLQLIAEGYANKQIADELGLSVKTVEKHRQQVMQKLDIHNIPGLVRHAVAKGIIESNLAGVPAVS